MKTLRTGVVTKEENGKIIVHSPYFCESKYYTRKNKIDAGKAFVLAFLGLILLTIITLIIR